MAQMMAQQGGGGGGGPKSAEEMAAQEEAQASQEEQRRAMLVNIMHHSARDRREPFDGERGGGALKGSWDAMLLRFCARHARPAVPHSAPALQRHALHCWDARRPSRPSRLPSLPAVARIALVKPDKARAIEDMIIMAARRGQIKEKVRAAGVV